MKSCHHLSHDQASKGHGSIPGLMSQTDLYPINPICATGRSDRPLSTLLDVPGPKYVMSNLIGC